MQEIEQLNARSTNCGTIKNAYEAMRQTDGERFFGDRTHVEFAKDSGSRIVAFATIKT